MSAVALFLSSFLVLFLETALIRWMPAYIRLLAYFSNFILLASFLGIGVGCLLATRRRNLFVWFPLIQFAVILAVNRLRLEVALPSTSTIYFSSGTASAVVPVESTLLLPLLFTSVAALFVTVAHRMGRELSGRPPLRAYVINLLGSVAGVAAFALVSWLELPPSVWFGVAAAAALPFVVQDRRLVAGLNVVLLAGSLAIVHRMEIGSLWSPYYRITIYQDNEDTVVEVNHIFHQSMAPVARKEYFYQWPYAVFGDTFDEVLILGAGSGTDVAAALRHGAKHVTAVDIDPVILRLGAERHPDKPYSDPRVTIVNDAARRDGALQLLPREMAGRSAGQHVRDGVRPRSARPRASGSRVSRRDARRPAACGAHRAAAAAARRHGVRTVARAEPRASARARCQRRPRNRQLAVPLHARAGAARPLPRGARAGARRVGARRVAGPGSDLPSRSDPAVLSRSDPGQLVVALLLSWRRLHAARDEVDRAVRAAVGIHVVVGIAGDCVGAGDGARERVDRESRRDPPPRAHRRRAAGADRGQLCRAGRARGVRQPDRGVAVLRRPGVQPGLLRRPAVQHELQGVLVHGG